MYLNNFFVQERGLSSQENCKIKKGLKFQKSPLDINKKIRFSENHPCTLSLNNFPAVKAGTRLAGIAIFSPVLGFNP